MAKAKTLKYYPLPEALPTRDGQDPEKPWDVGEIVGQGGRTDNPGRQMLVPLDNEDISRNIRRHEMGHGRWSPVENPNALAARHGVSVEALQRAEDLRVNTALQFAAAAPLDGRGLHSDEDIQYIKTAVERIGESDPKRAFRLAAYELTSAMQTGSFGRLQQAFRGTKYERAHRIAEAVWNAMARDQGAAIHYGALPFERTLEGAKYMDRVLGMMDDYFDNEAQADSEGDQKAMVPEMSEEQKDAAREAREKAERERAAREEARRKLERDRMNTTLDQLPAAAAKRDPKWARMTLDQPTRKRPRKKKAVAKKNRSADEGVVPRNMHRVCTDGRIFSYKRKQPGGAVMIDGSGSMHITAEQVRELVELAPQALVAIYSGNNNDGVLRVLAKDGLMVEDEFICRPAGCNNSVDGPALEWMVKQKQTPMVWVSDGEVTGDENTGFNAQLKFECQTLCRKKRITQVKSVTEAITYFKDYHRKASTR
jgi:hypothetical protein